MSRATIFAVLGILSCCSSLPVKADSPMPPSLAPKEAPQADAPAPSPNVQDEVVARSFRLVDKNGNTTLVINSGDDDKSPKMVLYDAKGQARLAITVDSGDSPFVAVYTPEGKVALTAGYDADKKDPEISLYDQAEKQRTTMAIVGDSPVLAIYRKDGNLAASMEIDDDIANVNVASEKNLTSMFAKPNGDVGLALLNDSKPRGIFGLLGAAQYAGLTISTGQGEEGIALVGIEGKPFIALEDQHNVRLRLSLGENGLPKIDFNNKDGKPTQSLP